MSKIDWAYVAIACLWAGIFFYVGYNMGYDYASTCLLVLPPS